MTDSVLFPSHSSHSSYNNLILCLTQSMCELIRVNPSGIPTAQGTAHEAIPIN